MMLQPSTAHDWRNKKQQQIDAGCQGKLWAAKKCYGQQMSDRRGSSRNALVVTMTLFSSFGEGNDVFDHACDCHAFFHAFDLDRFTFLFVQTSELFNELGVLVGDSFVVS
jgi:hypothetical protein